MVTVKLFDLFCNVIHTFNQQFES